MIAIMSNGFIIQLVLRTARRRSLDRGAYLFHRDDPVRFVFVIGKGAIELVRPQPDGNPIVLQRATCHAVLAEASLYSKVYHCDAVAKLPSEIFALSKATFLSHLRTDRKFSELWSSHLAREVQAARYRSEILSRKTVTERLDIWLDWHDIGLPPKGEWKGLAVQIGVSPEALYRELSKRRSLK
jgi:CRP-like cAMP-binding protein